MDERKILVGGFSIFAYSSSILALLDSKFINERIYLLINGRGRAPTIEFEGLWDWGEYIIGWEGG